MSGEFLGVFESAAIFLMGGDPGRAESVVTDRGRHADGLAAAFDHGQHVAPVHWFAGKSGGDHVIAPCLDRGRYSESSLVIKQLRCSLAGSKRSAFRVAFPSGDLGNRLAQIRE